MLPTQKRNGVDHGPPRFSQVPVSPVTGRPLLVPHRVYLIGATRNGEFLVLNLDPSHERRDEARWQYRGVVSHAMAGRIKWVSPLALARLTARDLRDGLTHNLTERGARCVGADVLSSARRSRKTVEARSIHERGSSGSANGGATCIGMQGSRRIGGDSVERQCGCLLGAAGQPRASTNSFHVAILFLSAIDLMVSDVNGASGA